MYISLYVSLMYVSLMYIYNVVKLILEKFEYYRVKFLDL